MSSLPQLQQEVPDRPSVPTANTTEPQQPVAPIAESQAPAPIAKNDDQIMVEAPPGLATDNGGDASPTATKTGAAQSDTAQVSTAPAAPAEPVKEEVKTPAPEPVAEVKTDTNGAPVSWSLQVASFKDEQNADRLMNKLKSQGFKSYQALNGGLHKVYVGPELDKDALNAIKDQVKSKFKLNGFVVRYQP
ncbi:SPOR domain-containing protein [Pokkaliibacter sp. CJK22405]|uniref:SPOR domain-containing protein n=1 Tax=Pokkaliibacter sp. CJK22405 TaxID=3384615 RepID=UPI003984C854